MVPNAGKLVGMVAPFAAWRTGNQPNTMIVAGVVLSASAVALLAHRLARAGNTRLAEDVGRAVDADWNELVLAQTEKHEILRVLVDCPAVLQPLRAALQAGARSAGGA